MILQLPVILQHRSNDSMGSLLLVVGLYGHTEMYSSVELCITGNLSLGSVGLHSSVQLCIAKGWFADVS